MDLENIIKKAEKIKMAEFDFENPCIEMLEVNENNYLESVSKQPTAIAYFGSLYKNAQRELEDMELYYKNRYNEMYGECSDIISKQKIKSTQRDVDALIRTKYTNELEDIEKRIKILKKNKDLYEMFYEGWKAKSFALASFTSLVTTGFISPKTITEDDVSEGVKKYIENKKNN
jgi:hypothetical protein